MCETNSQLQESSKSDGKRLFEISRAEQATWSGVVEAESEEEARQLWEEHPEKLHVEVDLGDCQSEVQPEIVELDPVTRRALR